MGSRKDIDTADDEKPSILAEAGVSAYVRVDGSQGELRVVLCRACGTSSPPLAAGHETDWFKRHAAEDREEHRRRRSNPNERFGGGDPD
jgi:hypothetical protein